MDAPTPTRYQNKGRTCRYEGCHFEAETGGYCNGHYQRDRKGQPMEPPIRKFVKRQTGPCPWPGCENEIETAGLCQLHYRRKIEGRDMDAPRRAPRKSRAGIDRFVTKDGYVEVKQPDHFGKSLGRRREWFYEHRYVMEQYLERPLHKGENVHHINGDRSDNRVENLELWTSQQPAGQRVVELLNWAYDLRERYQDDREKLLGKQLTMAIVEDAP